MCIKYLQGRVISDRLKTEIRFPYPGVSKYPGWVGGARVSYYYPGVDFTRSQVP